MPTPMTEAILRTPREGYNIKINVILLKIVLKNHHEVNFIT